MFPTFLKGAPYNYIRCPPVILTTLAHKLLHAAAAWPQEALLEKDFDFFLKSVEVCITLYIYIYNRYIDTNI